MTTEEIENPNPGRDYKPAAPLKRVNGKMVSRTREELADYFWGRVKKGTPNQCWWWLGRRTISNPKAIYGRMKRKNDWILAHRVAYELHHGEIPKGLGVLHTCDHPLCVNPNHLYAGTQAQNMRDKMERGRANFVGRPRKVINTKPFPSPVAGGANEIPVTILSPGLKQPSSAGQPTAGRAGGI